MKGEVNLIVVFSIIVLLGGGVFLFFNYQKSENDSSSDSSLSDIKTRGKLVVGSDIPYGVMEFFDEDGNPAGIDVDIAKEIASEIGVELDYKDYDWENLFSAVKSGEVDLMISSLTITEERSKEMFLSAPYFSGGQVIIVRADNQNIKLPGDLKGKRVGVQKETTGHYEVQKYVSEELIILYSNYDSTPTSGIFYDLESGIIDAAVLDYIVGVGIARERPPLKLSGKPFTQEYYGIATKMGNEELIEEVNKILRELKRTSRLDEIKSKWGA